MVWARGDVLNEVWKRALKADFDNHSTIVVSYVVYLGVSAFCMRYDWVVFSRPNGLYVVDALLINRLV